MANVKSECAKIIDPEKCLERMRGIVGARNNSELGKIIGMSSSRMSNWSGRSGIPVQVVFDFCVDRKVDFNYVCFGDESPPWSSGTRLGKNAIEKVIGEIDTVKSMVSQLELWLRSNEDADARAREIEGTLKTICPDFREWQKKREQLGKCGTPSGAQSVASGE